jgi:DNA-binding PadR family transcriptional regulator
MAARGPYTELEYLVLALLGDGCKSGYDIRKFMNLIPGGRWSAESGSVYRVLRRLEGDGLIEVAGRSGSPKRERTEYKILSRGRELVRSWLTLPPSRSEFAFLVDPLRTRSCFLGSLTPDEQVRVVRTWIEHSRRFLEDLESQLGHIGGGPEGMPAIAGANLSHLANARQVWLRKLLAQVRAPGTESSN